MKFFDFARKVGNYSLYDISLSVDELIQANEIDVLKDHLKALNDRLQNASTRLNQLFIIMFAIAFFFLFSPSNEDVITFSPLLSAKVKYAKMVLALVFQYIFYEYQTIHLFRFQAFKSIDIITQKIDNKKGMLHSPYAVLSQLQLPFSLARFFNNKEPFFYMMFICVMIGGFIGSSFMVLENSINMREDTLIMKVVFGLNMLFMFVNFLRTVQLMFLAKLEDIQVRKNLDNSLKRR